MTTGDNTYPCPACQGTGTLRVVLQPITDPSGVYVDDATCDVDCNLCRGTGRMRYATPCGRVHADDPGRTCSRPSGHVGSCYDRRGSFPTGRRIGGAA